MTPPSTDSKASAAPASPDGAPILDACRRLLRPLVRWLISHQVTFPMLAGLLKEIYVASAEEDFPEARSSRRGGGDRKRPTDSRITLMTGVHRKDVARFRAAGAPSEGTRNASMGAQLVARWLADPASVDERGHALPLPRRPAIDGGPSFEDLVRSVSKDIRPRAVLDEWLRLGIAELDDDDRVILRQEAFVPREGFSEKAHFLAWNLHDHVAAATSNLDRVDGADTEAAPHFERSVFYADLRPESVAELRAMAGELGMETLTKLNRRAAALQELDRGQAGADRRMRFGSYFYDAPLGEASGDDADDAGDDEPARGAS